MNWLLYVSICKHVNTIDEAYAPSGAIALP